MLDYKDIIIKHYVLGMSGREIARQLNVSKSGVNDFLKAFEKCEAISFPLPEGITNYGIAERVYGSVPGAGGRDLSFEYPDFEEVSRMISARKNMTLVFLWNRYAKKCQVEEKKFYQYRQFCELYGKWCEENYDTLHFQAVIGQKMEVDFAGQTFKLIDRLSGEVTAIVIFVAVLPYSQYIYAEGMISTKEPQWIEANNNALLYFGGVPSLVVCDNCKQAVSANKDWIEPELNKDYAAWAEHNHTAILPAKIKKPRFKSSVENAIGILEKGFFHDLEERQYFSLGQFNKDLWDKLDELNHLSFKKKEHSRYYYWEEEKQELMPLPSMQYQYMERRTAKVSSDFHVRFDNAYYSVDKAFLHKKVSIGATASTVKIFSQEGQFICEWPRAVRKGQWSTNPEHLPDNYKNFSEWSAAYFIRKAMTVGPNTVNVVKRILASRKLEIQTYRLCLGILNFAKRYGKQTLEECCKQALELDKVTYTFIKSSISAVAEDIRTPAHNSKTNEEKNKGGFVMDSEAMDINHLLSRSDNLIQRIGKEDTGQ
jgi:transposase